VIEAIKNLCGVSVLPSKEYHDYEEFNLRKFQSKVVGSTVAASVESLKARKDDEGSESDDVVDDINRIDDDREEDN
jgi:hypothetical protein